LEPGYKRLNLGDATVGIFVSGEDREVGEARVLGRSLGQVIATKQGQDQVDLGHGESAEAEREEEDEWE
jgi:hypothetical protein